MEDILNLILKGESETVEFKKSTASLREGIETLCAFANHKGGYLIFGVEDNGKIIGLIAKIFYLMGVFENWGGGTLKIISETVKSGKPPPEFFYGDRMFRLELYRESFD